MKYLRLWQAGLLVAVFVVWHLLTTPGLLPAYVVAGWPQTIAITDDPETNFSSVAPLNLRAFLTIVGTRAGTHVRVRTKARIVRGGVIPETPVGEAVDLDCASISHDAGFGGHVGEGSHI